MRQRLAAMVACGLALAVICGCGAMHKMAAGKMAPKTARAYKERDAAAAPAPDRAMQGPQADPAQAARLVIYTADIYVVVQQIADSLQRIKTEVEALGGYMQAMQSQSITLKVPAKKFHDALALVEKLGKVTKKDIQGTDVTDQVRDLRIRLQNAETLRQRLLKLLEKADKVEDTLKVEKELGRITETIELLKGKLQQIEHQVAFSTLTVHLNSALPQREIETEIPFSWVRSLGADLVRGTTGYPARHTCPFRPHKFRLPDAYIRYYEGASVDRAMSANGMMLLVQRHRNYSGGSLDFWTQMVRSALTKKHAIAVQDPAELKLRTGVPARMLFGTKEIGGKPYGYLIALATFRGHVYTFEAWGPKEQFDKDRPALETAIKSLRVGPRYMKLYTLVF